MRIRPVILSLALAASCVCARAETIRMAVFQLELVSVTDYRGINLKKPATGESMAYYLQSSKFRDSVRIVSLPFERVAVYCIFSNSDRGKRLCGEFGI